MILDLSNIKKYKVYTEFCFILVGWSRSATPALSLELVSDWYLMNAGIVGRVNNIQCKPLIRARLPQAMFDSVTDICTSITRSYHRNQTNNVFIHIFQTLELMVYLHTANSCLHIVFSSNRIFMREPPCWIWRIVHFVPEISTENALLLSFRKLHIKLLESYTIKKYHKVFFRRILQIYIPQILYQISTLIKNMNKDYYGNL